MEEEVTKENESPVDPPAEETTAAETSAEATAGEGPAGEAQAPEGPADSGRYDFGEAQRLSEGQLRQLRQVHERFAKELTTNLASLTRRSVKLVAVSCAPVENGEADRELTQSRLRIVLDSHPLDARITVGMKSELVFPLLEALLGAKVGGGADVNRELTEIELSVLQDLHAVLVRELERAWRPAARFTLQIVEQQTEPNEGISAPSNDGLLLAVVDLEVEDSAGRISLLYPARIGREIHGADVSAASDVARRPEVLQQAVFERLKSSVLTMESRLLGATMSLKDLSDLRTGDLVCLDIPLDKPIDIAINGMSRFSGRLAHGGRKRAMRIHEVVPPKVGEQWQR